MLETVNAVMKAQSRHMCTADLIVIVGKRNGPAHAIWPLKDLSIHVRVAGEQAE